MKDLFAPWQIVKVTVLKHLPYGLLVKLDGGQRGIVRTREISWERMERTQALELYPNGMTTEAMIVRVEPEGNLELSLRLADSDPWDNIFSHHRSGEIVEGVVTGVKRYGAFIEIERGLTGLLHSSRLPSWARKLDVLDLFWPGDHARVKISRIDEKSRRIDLSMEGTQRDLGISAGKDYLKGDAEPTRLLNDPFSLEELVKKQSHLVLVIEDDPEQAKLMTSWLTKLGQRTVTAQTAELGLDLIQRECPDIAIVDFGLPRMSGLEMIRELGQSSPLTRCYLATDWMRIQSHADEIETLQSTGMQVMIKPILPEDLMDALLGSRPDPASRVNQEEASASVELALPALDSYASLEALTPVLEMGCREMKFDYAMLFSIDPSGHKVEILAQTSRAAFDPSMIGDLVHSPIRDVAEERIVVSRENLPEGVPNPQFNYLQRFCRFSACLGVQVPEAGQDRLALFFFHRKARPIAPEQTAFAQALSLVVGTILDKKIFQEKARNLHRVALLGQMASNLVHEINHSLSLLDPSLDTLALRLEQIHMKIGSGEGVTEADILPPIADLKNARQSLGVLYNMTRLFSAPFIQKKEEYIRLDELIQTSIRLLREISQRYKVPINSVSPEGLLFLHGRGSLIMQVLWNLLLNAIEQISETRPNEGGAIRVSIEQSTSSAEQPTIRILVEDNGPGIHRRLWEKIFEAGYTTRLDGSGLGLYISRGILQSLRGSLYVQESCVLGGTTFVIELPHRI